MPSALPDGEAVPDDGALPATALQGLSTRPFGIYLHVPFCSVRCGYCDFNTYTATELGGGASQASYARTACAEVALAGAVLGDAAPPVDTVFVGGGTPTLLPVADLALLLEAVRARFGLADDAEVTTEANPDSVTADSSEGVARERLHARQLRHAVGGAARTGHARPHARPRARAAGRRAGRARPAST